MNSSLYNTHTKDLIHEMHVPKLSAKDRPTDWIALPVIMANFNMPEGVNQTYHGLRRTMIANEIVQYLSEHRDLAENELRLGKDWNHFTKDISGEDTHLLVHYDLLRKMVDNKIVELKPSIEVSSKAIDHDREAIAKKLSTRSQRFDQDVARHGLSMPLDYSPLPEADPANRALMYRDSIWDKHGQAQKSYVKEHAQKKAAAAAKESQER